MADAELLALRAGDGATVTLERYPILLGRSVPGGIVPDVDVTHLDPGEAVDNRHCELTLDEGGVEVHDLGGVSGTWVDGRRLPPGGRALLRVGGSLRVAGVTLELVPASDRRPAPSYPAYDSSQLEPTTAGPEWRESDAGPGVPPPPSASSVRPPQPVPPLEPRHPRLDLTGAPLLARPELEGGAEAVRLTTGLPLQVRRQRVWASEGPPLSPGDLADAVGPVRRALGLGEDALSGHGHVGDLELDFLTPPLAAQAYLAAVASGPDPVPGPLLDLCADLIAGGGTLLVAMRHPEVALGALAGRLQGPSRRPRVLSYQDPRRWVPLGWPSLDGQATGALEDALNADPLFLVRPPSAVLATLLDQLPRRSGGAVVALESASVEAALEECVRRLPVDDGSRYAPADHGRAHLAAVLGPILTRDQRGWCLLRAQPDGDDGRWSLEALPSNTP
ncbi:MAG TPA: FHA domain-containing protein [Candidatus Nanopelagicaceae bacterium]|nr:FHA domain-containing protein [Candidatus Nanopelagicaceae bacterium]